MKPTITTTSKWCNLHLQPFSLVGVCMLDGFMVSTLGVAGTVTSGTLGVLLGQFSVTSQAGEGVHMVETP
jgi:hypothetical protein